MTDKAALRQIALSRRAEVASATRRAAAAMLRKVIAPHLGQPLAGYMPMRGEADPIPAMTDAAPLGPVCVPVIEGRARPLRFRAWTPGCAMVPGKFGALIPEEGAPVVPHVVITPLVAFSETGARLGYGGGFYDRTLAALRRDRKTLAIGLAFEAQMIPDLPQEPTDIPLDLIVTEDRVITTGA